MCVHLSLKSYCSLLFYCKNKEHKNAGEVYRASPLLLSSFYLLLYFPYFKISFNILLRRRAQDYNLTIVMRMGYVCAISHFHYNLCGKSNVTEFLMSYILHEHFFFSKLLLHFNGWCCCRTLQLWSFYSLHYDHIGNFTHFPKVENILIYSLLLQKPVFYTYCTYLENCFPQNPSCGWVQDTDITKDVCFLEWYYGNCRLQNLSGRIEQFVSWKVGTALGEKGVSRVWHGTDFLKCINLSIKLLIVISN